MKKNNIVPALWFKLLLSLITIIIAYNNSYSQSYYSKAEKDGFVLTKLVSDTIVNSGRNFTYSITFSIPAGATNVKLSDVLPASLEFISSSFVINQTCAPGTAIVVPTANQTIPTLYQRGATFELRNISAPCGAVGSYTLVVRYPIGTTCDGTPVRNQACVSYTINGKDGSVCTGFVNTIARAINTWKVSKSVVNSANQGGTCPNAIIDSIVTYRVCVSKDNGIEGQMNLVNARVTDILPANAVFVSSPSGCFTASGQTLTWIVPNQTVANYNNVCCTFQVRYPRAQFPIGSLITNKAVLNAGAGGDTVKPCVTFRDSSSVCSEVRAYTNGQISKWVATNSQPGCAGTYYIRICNTGNTPLTNIRVADTLPTYISNPSVTSVNVPTGWTYGVAGTNPAIVSMSSVGLTLAPGACCTLAVNFTIALNAPVGTVITNCAYIRAGSVPDTVDRKVCFSFTVKEAKAIPCLWKEVCNPKSCYSPGDTITYRLRVQNIGGGDLSGSTITDNIDKNLVYLSNSVRAYTDTTYTVACGSKSTDTWGNGVFPTYTSTTNKVTFSVPTIGFDCDAYGTCGQNGSSVPFYFIEFKVRVSDSTAIGSINNSFSITGGTLQTTVTNSNIVGITTCANTSYWIEKEVRVAGVGNYSTTATISNGGSVDYRLRLHIPIVTPALAALRHVSFIEELPKDVSSIVDNYLMVCTPQRASMFALKFSGFSFSSTPNPAALGVPEVNVRPWYPAIKTWAPTLNCPANMFAGGCTTMDPASQWNVGFLASINRRNFGFYFDQYAFIPSTTILPWVEFKAQADTASAKDSIACNTFAASAAVRHIVNGGTYFDSPVAESESQPVCIKMIKDAGDPCKDVVLCNTSFEQISPSVQTLIDANDGLNDKGYAWVPQDSIPCWKTTASDQLIEIWESNFQNVPAYSGNYFAELNATQVGTLYQQFNVTGSITITVGFAHRGRYANPDVMKVYLIQRTPTVGTKQYLTSTTTGLNTFSDNNSAWTYTTTVPRTFNSTEYGTWELGFESISSNGDTLRKDGGNFLDSITVTCTTLVPCKGDEIGIPTIDSNCCTGSVPIQNLSSPLSPITQIQYTIISGGQMKDIKLLGSCATTGSYTIPAVVYGSTSGSLNLVPPCTSPSFNLSIDVLATLPTTCIQITVVHANGTTCIDTICIKCKPVQQSRCDSMFVLPQRFINLNQEWRIFEIYNLMYPTSPICSVKVNVTPEPVGHWTGGGAAINNPLPILSPIWGLMNSGTPAYSLINLAPGGPWGTPANNSIYFHIGIDFSNNAVYQWDVTTVHCDGRECKFKGEFCAQTDPAACPSSSSTAGVVTPNTLGRLIAGSTRIKGGPDTVNPSGTIKFATFSLANPNDATMLAVTAADVSLSTTAKKVGRSYMTDASATVVFSEVLSEKDDLPVSFLMQRKDSGSTKPVKINVILYDDKARPIGTKSIEVNTIVSSVDHQSVDKIGTDHAIIFRPEPSPASDDVSIRYWIPQSQVVDIELYTMLGEKIKTLTTTSGNSGYNTLRTNVSSLPQGAYLLKLITTSGITSTTFIVVH